MTRNTVERHAEVHIRGQIPAMALKISSWPVGKAVDRRAKHHKIALWKAFQGAKPDLKAFHEMTRGEAANAGQQHRRDGSKLRSAANCPANH